MLGGRSGSLAGCAVAFALVVGAAHAGPPYMTDDPDPVDLGHWEAYVFSQGAIDRDDASGAGPAIELNYGAAPNLQLHLAADLAYDDPSGGPSRMGPGDTELGFKYRLVDPGKDDWWPTISVFPAVEIPTGNAKRGLGAGYTDVYLPVWVEKSFGKWTIDTGGGYWINPGPGNRNYWFAGWLVQRQITDKLSLGAEIVHETSSAVGQSAATGFDIGGQYDFSEHHHLLFSVGRWGLAYVIDAAAAKDPFTYYLGYQWTY
jgi:hypothetical protein